MRITNMKNKNKGINIIPMTQNKSRNFTHRCGMLVIADKISALASLKF